MDNFAFWGIFLIIIGFTLLIRVIFNIEFPVFKVLAGLFFVLLGIKIIFGNFNLWPLKTGDNEFIFTSARIESNELHRSYHLIFSEGTFSLGNLRLGGKKRELNINSVFSGSTVHLPPDVPVNINVEAVFASVKMPGRNSPVIGRGNYSSEGFDPGLPHLDITVSIVFGSIVLIADNR
jgi:predicted membrane protein